MKALIAGLTAMLVAPGLALAATDGMLGTFTQGQTLLAVNSEGVRATGTHGTTVTIFDSFSGTPNFTTTGGSPRTFMGDSFTVAPGTGTDVRIDEATVYLASTATQSFSNGLTIRLQFYDDFDGANASAIFSNPVGGVQTFTVPGPVNLTLNTFTPIAVVFPAPLVFSGLTIGLDINYQGDNGAGPASSDTITSLIRTVNEPGPGTLPVGSFTASGTFAAPDWGFYRNVANQTNFNHPNGDRRTFAGVDDILLVLELRGAVTPVELTGFSVE
jgi:hypothetical protein